LGGFFLPRFVLDIGDGLLTVSITDPHPCDVRTKPLPVDGTHKPRLIGGIGRAADLPFESVLESDLLQLFTVLDREPRTTELAL
jgi:hypothetical protein